MSGVADGALIIDTGLDNSGFIRDAAQFRRAVDTLTRAVQSSGQQMAGGMNGYLQALQRTSGAARGAAADQKTLTREIAKTEAAIRRVEERQELARRKFEAAKEDAIGRAMDRFNQDNQGAELLPWEDEEQAMEQFAEDAARVAQEASAAVGEFEDSTAFRNLSAEVEFLKEKLAGLQDQLANVGQSSGETAQNVANVASAGLAGGGWAAFGSAVSTAASGFLRIAGSAGKAALNVAKMAGGAALSYLRKLAEGARNAAIQFAKLAANALRAGGKAIAKGFAGLGSLIGKGTKALLGFNREHKSTNSGLKQGLMAVLRYGLGIRGLFALFRRLRTAVKDGLSEIAKRSPEVNQALTSMRSALNALKGSLATAFAPIVTAVAPALSRLINMLASAVNAIGALIAALTGQSTYQKAVAGLDAVGGAAGGASGAVKELKRQLAGFDQLEVLSANDSGGGGGGGGGGAGGGLTYSTEEISSGIMDFVSKLKELWANADYEGIGREIAGAINGAFEIAKNMISWDTLGEKITEVVTAITEIFNGLVDAIDWTLIGETFGEGINTLIRTINLLLTGIDWENLGKGFAEGLNGLVDTVSWSELGELFANKFNALIGLIKGFAQDFDWGKAGTAFAKTVKGLVNKVSWSDVEAALVAGINGAIEALSSAVEGFSWLPKATKTFAETINGIVAKVKWAELGGSLAGLLNTALDALHSAIEAFDWGAAGTAFGKLVSGITSKVKWAQLGGDLAQLLNGAVEALRSALSAFDWGDAGKTFAAAVNKLIATVKWAELGGSLAQLLNSALDALHSALAEFNWGEAGTAFAAAISSLLSKVKWAQLGGDLAVLLNGAVAALRSALEAFNWGDAGTTFSDTINALVGTVKWKDLGQLLSDSLKSALTWLVAALSQFNFGTTGQAFADVINGFFEDPTLWAKAGEAVSTAVKGLFTWGADLLGNLDTTQIAEDLKAFMGTVDWPGIAQAIWNFLVVAFKALGNILIELIFGDGIEETKKAIEERNFELNVTPEVRLDRAKLAVLQENLQATLNEGGWYLDIDMLPDLPPEAIQGAVQDFVRQWNEAHPKAPVSLEAEEGSVPQMAAEFIQQWNKEHPNAQIDVNLPGDTGSKVQKQWDNLDPDLQADADIDPNFDFDAWSEECDEAFGKPFEVDATANVEAGKIDPTVKNVVESDGTTKTTTVKALSSKDSSSTATNVANADGTKKTTAIKALYNKDSSPTATNTVNANGTKKTTTIKALNSSGSSKTATNVANSNGTKKTTTIKALNSANSSKTATNVANSNGTTKTTTIKALNSANSSKTATNVANSNGTTKTTTIKALNSSGSSKTATRAVNADGTTKTTTIKLKNSSGSNGTATNAVNANGTTKTLYIEIKKKSGTSVTFEAKSTQGGAQIRVARTGGVIANGMFRRFASGGIISGGLAHFLKSVPKYASGTTRAHGTLFMAGEAGPEIMGHVNGRTEILNKSQLAQTMHRAVYGGMLAAMSRLTFRMPAMATGTVMPYEVAAQVAQTGADLRNTLNANNEDLIQTIISVAGQLAAAMRSQDRSPVSPTAGGLTAQELINDINRRTRMFGASPLEGM